ncbi:hypothetical protein NQ315_005083 [Exocentrus adspersus]|uniref:Tyr recombinase domain-containing protein n=1 Tax=Exocentrus adspersus TaxID=1586481 RepID=A0AAV8V553_9CUCU|nr:hypothetical protein NQ315_005083 [Exocentrus adspersus]
MLQKIIKDKAKGILVVTLWTAQPWYPLFEKLLCSEPLILHSDYNLLLSINRKPHPIWPHLTLVGVANLRPALPKYDGVWDPSIVLGYLGSLYPNETISLDLLTYKLVTLLALVTAHRAQTLALIEVENIVKVDDGVEIKIPAKLKTSRRNRLQPSLYLPSFADNPAKPFHAVSSQSVSRWIKNTLARSGINTEVFSAHSNRHAATSSAKRRGVSLDIIRQAAGWSAQSGTFAKFYDKPLIDKSAFAKSILS